MTVRGVVVDISMVLSRALIEVLRLLGRALLIHYYVSNPSLYGRVMLAIDKRLVPWYLQGY